MAAKCGMVLRTDGTKSELVPANGTHFRLPELYAALDVTLVDVVTLNDELILIIDDEGLLCAEPQQNVFATVLTGGGFIAGNVLLCHTTMFR